jgi:hypothetical protein
MREKPPLPEGEGAFTTLLNRPNRKSLFYYYMERICLSKKSHLAKTYRMKLMC